MKFIETWRKFRLSYCESRSFSRLQSANYNDYRTNVDPVPPIPQLFRHINYAEFIFRLRDLIFIFTIRPITGMDKQYYPMNVELTRRPSNYSYGISSLRSYLIADKETLCRGTPYLRDNRGYTFLFSYKIYAACIFSKGSENVFIR